MKMRGEYTRRENKQINQGTPLPHLKAWRLHAFLSQERLAELTGKNGGKKISKYTIGNIEKQIYGGASLLSIYLLADALGITPQQLIHEQPPDASQDEIDR